MCLDRRRMCITDLLHNDLVIDSPGSRVKSCDAAPCDDADVARSYLLAMWDGGGNVGPFLCLAERLRAAGHTVGAVAPAVLAGRLADAGVDLAGSPEGWLPGAADVLAAADACPPDVVVVDYMLTDALGGAERLGRPTVALVHTLYRELLTDGSPHPIGMAGPVEALNPGRVAAGLAPLASHADLLTTVDLVLVAAPRPLDAPAAVPANVDVCRPSARGTGPRRPLGAAARVRPPRCGVARDRRRPRGGGARAAPRARRAGRPAGARVRDPGGLRRSGRHRRGPAEPTVSGYVRHAAVLPHADLLVTHAGLGSVVAALAHGVPMVALPLDREQPDNARALARMGAGVALAPDAPADEIRAARGRAAPPLDVTAGHRRPRPRSRPARVSDQHRRFSSRFWSLQQPAPRRNEKTRGRARPT